MSGPPSFPPLSNGGASPDPGPSKRPNSYPPALPAATQPEGRQSLGAEGPEIRGLLQPLMLTYQGNSNDTTPATSGESSLNIGGLQNNPRQETSPNTEFAQSRENSGQIPRSFNCPKCGAKLSLDAEGRLLNNQPSGAQNGQNSTSGSRDNVNQLPDSQVGTQIVAPAHPDMQYAPGPQTSSGPQSTMRHVGPEIHGTPADFAPWPNPDATITYGFSPNNHTYEAGQPVQPPTLASPILPDILQGNGPPGFFGNSTRGPQPETLEPRTYQEPAQGAGPSLLPAQAPAPQQQAADVQTTEAEIPTGNTTQTDSIEFPPRGDPPRRRDVVGAIRRSLHRTRERMHMTQEHMHRAQERIHRRGRAAWRGTRTTAGRVGRAISEAFFPKLPDP